MKAVCHKRFAGKRDASPRQYVLIVSLALLFLLTGCQYTAAPADLLEKPSLSEEKQLLAQAVEKLLHNHSKLMLPIRDDYNEAIRLIDIDGDGTMEAVVTYYNEYSVPELMVLKKSGGAWRQWALVQKSIARQIEYLKLLDIDHDGYQELIIGWIGTFDSPNELEVYSFQSKPVLNEQGKQVLPPLDTIPYANVEVADLDEDGRAEFIIAMSSGANKEIDIPSYRLSVLRWGSGGLKELAGETLFDGVHAYDRIVLGKISPYHYGIVLEGSTGAHSMYTTMYAWRDGKLSFIYPDESSGEEGLKSTPTMSEDINGDGIIELNWITEAPGNPEVPYSDTMWINTWMQWDGYSGYNKVAEEFSDYMYLYQLQIPDEWSGRYTLRKPELDDHGSVTIEYWNEETKARAELATIAVVPYTVWPEVEARWKEKALVYRPLHISQGNIYLVIKADRSPDNWLESDKQAYAAMLSAMDRLEANIKMLHEN